MILYIKIKSYQFLPVKKGKNGRLSSDEGRFLLLPGLFLIYLYIIMYKKKRRYLWGKCVSAHEKNIYLCARNFEK